MEEGKNKATSGYDLSRQYWDFAFENPELVKPIHAAIYFFAIEHCNRLGWKEKFGFPSQMVMDAIGIKNWRTYSSAFDEIVDWGFFDVKEKSKNQYSATIIAIVKNTKANTKALSKAIQKHSQKHSTKHSRSTVGINKQYNQEPITKNQEPISVQKNSARPNNDFIDSVQNRLIYWVFFLYINL